MGVLKTLNFKHSVRVRFSVRVRISFTFNHTQKVHFCFNRTQLKINQDFENNIWRHLLNIINARIVDQRY